MSFALPPDLQSLVSKHFALGNYASEEDVLREALLALDDRQAQFREAQERIQRFQEGNRIHPAKRTRAFSAT